MGHIIRKYRVRSSEKEKPQLLRLYFDTGSPRTFVKQSIASKMSDVTELSYPKIFHGLGNGEFAATHAASVDIQLLDMWVPHLCYVVADDVLDPEYDILIGHDFMQIYDIHVRPKRSEVEMRKDALRMALKVRGSRRASSVGDRNRCWQNRKTAFSEERTILRNKLSKLTHLTIPMS